MTAHLLRLIWNRRRQNLLLSLEILLSFLVLFGVTVVALQFLARWRAPLGFDAERVWTIEVRRPGDNGPGAAGRFREMLRMLRSMPNIESAAGAFILPYSGSSAGSGLALADGRYIPHAFNQGTDELRDVLKIPLVAGRWFSAEDDAFPDPPVVVNQRLAREVFGDSDPMGRTIAQVQPPNAPPMPSRLRVVGVIDDFRHDELAAPGLFLFHRMQITGAEGGPEEFGPLLSGLPSSLAIRMAPGTTASVEETLVRQLEAIAPGWTFRVETMTATRRNTLRASLAPLAIAAIVTFFLLAMVALGLTGVVWQSLTTRTPELGLRRANGATASDVWLQILSELVLLTTLAIAAGIAIVAQLPLLPAEPLGLSAPPMQVWGWSIAVSAGVIYLLTLLCGVYPSRLASRLQPADALRYE